MRGSTAVNSIPSHYLGSLRLPFGSSPTRLAVHLEKKKRSLLENVLDTLRTDGTLRSTKYFFVWCSLPREPHRPTYMQRADELSITNHSLSHHISGSEVTSRSVFSGQNLEITPEFGLRLSPVVLNVQTKYIGTLVLQSFIKLEL